MRFLVFSDTHGVREPMFDLYKRYIIDGIIHLGDHIADARWLLAHTDGHPVYQVRGNCDYGDPGPEELIFPLGGLTTWLVHGHRYGVKGGVQALYAAARAKGARIVLFGHTHQPFLQEKDGILMMNPGSFKQVGGDFAVLEIEDGVAKGALLQYEQ